MEEPLQLTVRMIYLNQVRESSWLHLGALQPNQSKTRYAAHAEHLTLK